LLNGSGQSVDTVLATVPVRDIMAGDVITVAPETSVVEVASLLHKAGLHRAFVVDGGRLCGVVSSYDVLRAASGLA
jgi:CBS domain-containing protein